MIHEKESIDGQHYFTVTSRNGKVLVTSETYLTKQGMRKGIHALIKRMVSIKIAPTKPRTPADKKLLSAIQRLDARKINRNIGL